jgi:hypothetical protein
VSKEAIVWFSAVAQRQRQIDPPRNAHPPTDNAPTFVYQPADICSREDL